MFHQYIQDVSGAEEWSGKGNRPKLQRAWDFVAGRILNKYATVIDESDGVLRKIVRVVRLSGISIFCANPFSFVPA